MSRIGAGVVCPDATLREGGGALSRRWVAITGRMRKATPGGVDWAPRSRSREGTWKEGSRSHWQVVGVWAVISGSQLLVWPMAFACRCMGCTLMDARPCTSPKVKPHSRNTNPRHLFRTTARFFFSLTLHSIHLVPSLSVAPFPAALPCGGLSGSLSLGVSRQVQPRKTADPHAVCLISRKPSPIQVMIGNRVPLSSRAYSHLQQRVHT
ncbi:hypothetical protein GQ53DRAFT_152446 [Thozetella sp. PMI_491]|nr:hypothetical protein GQ53DRAFT_152446 [Thozetella sp. PMI_491]